MSMFGHTDSESSGVSRHKESVDQTNGAADKKGFTAATRKVLKDPKHTLLQLVKAGEIGKVLKSFTVRESTTIPCSILHNFQLVIMQAYVCRRY